MTRVNFPSLAPGRGKYEIPACQLDDRYVQLEEAVDVDSQVRQEWKKSVRKIIVSAITGDRGEHDASINASSWRRAPSRRPGTPSPRSSRDVAGGQRAVRPGTGARRTMRPRQL